MLLRAELATQYRLSQDVQAGSPAWTVRCVAEPRAIATHPWVEGEGQAGGESED